MTRIGMKSLAMMSLGMIGIVLPRCRFALAILASGQGDSVCRAAAAMAVRRRAMVASSSGQRSGSGSASPAPVHASEAGCMAAGSSARWRLLPREASKAVVRHSDRVFIVHLFLPPWWRLPVSSNTNTENAGSIRRTGRSLPTVMRPDQSTCSPCNTMSRPSRSSSSDTRRPMVQSISFSSTAVTTNV